MYTTLNIHLIFTHYIYNIFYSYTIYNIHVLLRYKYCKHMHILFLYIYIDVCMHTLYLLHGTSKVNFSQTIGHTSVLKHKASPRLLGILRMEEGGGTM